MAVVPEDMISNLPLDVTHQILQFLPATDAVRTSVLSSSWRHKWLALPDLILDECFTMAIQRQTNRSFARSRVPVKDRVLEYSNALNTILNKHVGPLRKFVLEIPSWFPRDLGIDQWLKFFCSKSANEFMQIQKHYWTRKLSCSFWSMDLKNLTHLELVNFSLVFLPTTFQGFPRLISLRLVNAGDIDKIELLISSCAKLEKLYVDTDESSRSLSIKAPNLQELALKGRLIHVVFQGTTKINTITLDIPWYLYLGATTSASFFSCLSYAENINLGNNFWQEFRGSEGVVVPNNMQRLKTLTILGADLRDRATMSLLVQLVRSSPQLQSLVIENMSLSDINEESDYEDSDMEDFVSANHPVFEGFGSLDRLKNVRVAWEFDSIDASDAALELIRLILLKSRVLETMSIEAKHKKRADNGYQDDEEEETDDDDDDDDDDCDDDDNDSDDDDCDDDEDDDYDDYDAVRGRDIAKKVLGYPRASDAKIIFKN